jgi:hypothetical protein
VEAAAGTIIVIDRLVMGSLGPAFDSTEFYLVRADKDNFLNYP